jgi:hypothetical protein
MRRLMTVSALVGVLTLAGASLAAAEQLPGPFTGVTSDNVTHLGYLPETAIISAEFAWTGDFFYTSSLDSINAYSYEITDEGPQISFEGTLLDANFENESMTYGERRNGAGEVVQRFVILRSTSTTSRRPRHSTPTSGPARS